MIERTFGVFKNRFRILKTAREGFSLDAQVRMVLVLAAIHNIINEHEGVDSLSEDFEGDEDYGNESVGENEEEEQGTSMLLKGDDIAQSMWRDYSAYMES